MRSLLLLAFLVVALGAGCASGGASLDAGGAPNGGSSGAAGSTGISGVPSSLTLAPIGTLDARAQVEVVVQAVPAGAYRVRFSLPTSSTLDPHDAQTANLALDMPSLGADWGDTLVVHDEITGATFHWGQFAFVRLEPWRAVAHLARVQLPAT